MVSPVTGPFSTTLSFNWPGTATRNFYMKRTWYRQAKPYGDPLPYTYEVRQITSSINGKASDSSLGPSNPSLDQAQAYNKCYEKFKNAAYQSVSAAETMAQRESGLATITKRLEQFTRFVKHLKRYQFQDALRDLGIVLSPTWWRGWWRYFKRRYGKGWRAVARSWSAMFLEFHLFWEPLANDIYNAAELLSTDFDPIKVKVKATVASKTSTKGGGNLWTATQHEFLSGVTLFGNVRISNPNLFLANQIGLTNPATLAWQLLPFSFVVDWFVNVESYLNSFTDFLGLSLTGVGRTTFLKDSTSQQWYTGFSWKGFCVRVQRYPGSLPGPTLRVRPPKALSPVRGATAAALLVQQLKR